MINISQVNGTVFTFMNPLVFLFGMVKMLELDCGDGCMTLNVLKPIDCTP